MARNNRKKYNENSENISTKKDDVELTEYEQQEILDEINESRRNWSSYYRQNISNLRDEKYFTFIDNWTAEQRTELNNHKKDVLQMNKIYDSVNKVLSQQRQHTAELQLRSLNGNAPDNLVKLNQDLLRYICFNSKSKLAYQTAFSDQISGGFGAFKLRTDYESPDSMHQTIFIDEIKEPEKTGFDPFAIDPTRCDGEFCYHYVVMSKKSFERENPDIPYPSSFPMDYEGGAFWWGTNDQIVVMQYYRKEYYTFDLHELSDGKIVRDEEWKKIESNSDAPPSDNSVISLFQQFIPKPTIVKTVKKKDHEVIMYRAIYNKVIERKKMPGNELPIILVPGGTVTIDGRDMTISFVRYARDAQIFHNYLLVDMAFSLKTGRKERYMGTPENVAGFEERWQDIANVQGLLLARPDPITGQMPIPMSASEIASSSMALFQQSELAIQNILGFYEANRGAESNAQSGVAYKEQQITGNMSVGVFYDNLNRAIEQCGRVVMSMKKEIYDGERKIPVLSQNGKMEYVDINRKFSVGMIDNDMTAGDFDIVIDAGPSAAIQKSQSLDILVKLCGLNPEVFPMVADYIAENLSLDSISGIVKRFKTLVPPNVIAAEEGKPMPPQPPNPQLILAQQQMKLQEGAQQIQQGKVQLEIQKIQSQVQQLHKEIEVAKIKAEAELQKAAIEHNSTMVETTGKIIDSHNNVKREVMRKY